MIEIIMIMGAFFGAFLLFPIFMAIICLFLGFLTAIIKGVSNVYYLRQEKRCQAAE